MHYKNGREAHNGDKVVLQRYDGLLITGILYDAQPGNDFCNGKLALMTGNDPCPNLKDCLHLDDVQGLLKATSETADAHHVLGIPRTISASDSDGTDMLTLLGRLRILQERAAPKS